MMAGAGITVPPADVPMWAVGHPLEPTTDVSTETAAAPSDAMARLQFAKERVRLAIDTMGEPAWRRAVHQPPPPAWAAEAAAAHPPGWSPASRAYYKLYEILRTCALRPPRDEGRTMRVAHLCEAPGGFVEAARDTYAVGARRGAYEWRAVSLADPRLPFAASLRRDAPTWCVTADVLASPAAVASALGDAAYDLVTADGAVAMDHDRLEEEAYPLCRAQAEAALALLRPGGTLVLKFFEGATAQTVALLAHVHAHFTDSQIIKPTLSRPTNSERYLVCTGRLADPDDGTPSAPQLPTRDDGDADAAPWPAAASAILPSLHEVLDALARQQDAALQRALLQANIMSGGPDGASARFRSSRTRSTKPRVTTSRGRRTSRAGGGAEAAAP